MDIDPQAVEVTVMSLYLKVLEDVDVAMLLKTALLPPLDGNIKCGNSLIGSDYWDFVRAEQGELFERTEAEERRVNPFDWDQEFGEVIRYKPGTRDLADGRGFDAVIGNPPYLNLTKGVCTENILAYYRGNYGSFREAQSKNLYALFIERMLSVISSDGLFSFIVPEGLARTRSYRKVRELIHEQAMLEKLLLFGKFVFKDAVIGSLVFVIRKGKGKGYYYVEHLGKSLEIDKSYKVPIDGIIGSDELMWDMEPETKSSLLAKRISELYLPSEKLFKFYKGMVVKERKKHLRLRPQKEDLPFLLGESIKRYYLRYKYYTSYDELTIVGGTKVLAKHLECPRLLIRRTGDSLCSVFTKEPQLIESTIYIVTGAEEEPLRYLLGLLNSKLFTFIVRQKMITNVQAYPQILMTDLKELRIRTIDFSDAADARNTTVWSGS